MSVAADLERARCTFTKDVASLISALTYELRGKPISTDLRTAMEHVMASASLVEEQSASVRKVTGRQLIVK